MFCFHAITGGMKRSTCFGGTILSLKTYVIVMYVVHISVMSERNQKIQLKANLGIFL